MSIAKIKRPPLSEKLEIMEALREDLRSNADPILVADWQRNLLIARRVTVEQGKEQVLDWDDVNDSFGGKGR